MSEHVQRNADSRARRRFSQRAHIRRLQKHAQFQQWALLSSWGDVARERKWRQEQQAKVAQLERELAAATRAICHCWTCRLRYWWADVCARPWG